MSDSESAPVNSSRRRLVKRLDLSDDEKMEEDHELMVFDGDMVTGKLLLTGSKDPQNHIGSVPPKRGKAKAIPYKQLVDQAAKGVKGEATHAKEIVGLSSHSQTANTIFTKSLSRNDIQNRLSIPTKFLKFFPILKEGGQCAVDFLVRDTAGAKWSFRLSVSKQGLPKPCITGDWLAFVRQNEVKMGDKITFFYFDTQDGAAGDVQFGIKVEREIFNWFSLANVQ